MFLSGRFRFDLETLDWKGLPETSTLVLCEKSQITAVESFITLAPGYNRQLKKYIHQWLILYTNYERNLWAEQNKL